MKRAVHLAGVSTPPHEGVCSVPNVTCDTPPLVQTPPRALLSGPIMTMSRTRRGPGEGWRGMGPRGSGLGRLLRECSSDEEVQSDHVDL